MIVAQHVFAAAPWVELRPLLASAATVAIGRHPDALAVADYLGGDPARAFAPSRFGNIPFGINYLV